ncbi:MAG: aminoacetone oxidase family FAD-binding enzyme [Bacteroidales bacterium]|nr:aminoacetone oxidase family FAD-binding enzyme [Candidatus Liminaster caballi]
MRVAVIGAGAAGCFCSVMLRRQCPDVIVDVYEAGSRPLAKVAVTGGGRCNLTNSFRAIRSLKEAYPRGEQVVRRAFCEFDHEALFRWFEAEGVPLVTQDDECVFPRSQDAMQIVETLTRAMSKAGVRLHTSQRIISVEQAADVTAPTGPSGACPGYVLRSQGGTFTADAVVVTTGGSPKVSGLSFLSPLNLIVEPPVPSLFSFNIAGTSPLMGLVVDPVTCGLVGTRMRSRGALLFTHWGMSGPAVLKLSSYAARHLAECAYRAQLMVSWLDEMGEDEVRSLILAMQSSQPSRQVGNTHPQQLPSRLWQYLIVRAGIREDQRWAEVGRKQINRLVATLTADVYDIEGQSRHKDEFVTCGGISLRNINPGTLECRTHPNLFFAGEVLDVDAITGGFNLQAAWSMGYVVAGQLRRLAAGGE